MHRVKNVAYDDDDDLYSDDDAGDDYDDNGAAGDGADAYTAEDRENFASLTPVVRAALEEAEVPQVSDKQIEEALWHYYWDVGKSVAYLKNSRTPRPPQQQQAKSVKKDTNKGSRFEAAAKKSADTAKSTISTNGLAKKTEALKLNAAPPAPSQPKIRSKGLDVPKVWAEERTKQNPSATFVVIGHVDHGKSTLMGRLLLDTGAVSQRDIDRYKKQAAEIGKASFALAWVMDTGSEERERGVTVDIAQHHFSTADVDFTILDAPGHRDFVPNMIAGASMADFAVLVVDANQLESGMKGQTREHMLLAHAVGIQRIVVAVNKLDATTPPWSEDVYWHVGATVTKLLVETGFAEENIALVPCSGLSGENVVKRAESSGATAWVAEQQHTLLRRLENAVSLIVQESVVAAPLRMQVADVYKGGPTNALTVAGRVRAGNVQVGDAVRVLPSGETAAVKSIEVHGDAARGWAVAGDMCTLQLADIEREHVRSGDALCSAAAAPVPLATAASVKALAIDALLPQKVDCHFGRLHVPGAVSQLVATLDEAGGDGAVRKKRPRIVKPGQTALLRLALDVAVPLEPGDRVVLRADGATVAAGVVVPQ